jgi:chromosome partitioning protein
MGKIVSIVNQKGGVGKTTTAVNLCAYLAYLGKHILLVDIDPQANATSGIGVDHKNLPHGIYEAIIGEKPIYAVIKHTLQDRLKIAPSNFG